MLVLLVYVKGYFGYFLATNMANVIFFEILSLFGFSLVYKAFRLENSLQFEAYSIKEPFKSLALTQHLLKVNPCLPNALNTLLFR